MKTLHKVGAFVIRRRASRKPELLLFTHADFPEAPIQIPGGGIEPDEDPDTAVMRELEEEAGLRELTLIRKLGVSEVASIVTRDGVLKRHCYLFDGGSLPDSWRHIVTGTGEDTALRFDYGWHPVARDFSLSGDLGYFLSPLHIPELYA